MNTSTKSKKIYCIFIVVCNMFTTQIISDLGAFIMMLDLIRGVDGKIGCKKKLIILSFSMKSDRISFTCLCHFLSKQEKEI